MTTPAEKITEAFLKGDDFVLSVLYKQTLPVVKKYVRKYGGTDDDAGDVFQDAMLAAWVNMNDGKYKAKETTEIGGYVFQIAKYKWLDKMKSAHARKSKRLEVLKMDPVDSPAIDMQDDRLHLLQKMYAALGEKCKQILGLFYYEKKSLEEIGQALSYDAATLRTMKYRCMMQLRKQTEAMKENAE